MAKFEDVLDIIGHIGFMQYVIIGFSILQESCAALSVYFLVFAESNTPSWTCGDDVFIGQNATVSGSGRGYDIEWSNTTGVCPIETCENITYNVNYTSIVTEWNFVCDKEYMSKMTVSLLLMGMGIGTVFAGQLADLFGRRKIILVYWALVMLFQTCLGFMPNYPMYLVLRILNGMALGGIVSISCILPTEYVGSKWRVVVSCRMGWRVGSFVLIGLAFAIREWRYLAYACGLFCLPFFPLAWFFMPESARWSIQKGRFDEAMYWLKMIAKYNKRPCPDMELLKQIAEVEKEEKQNTTRYTYLDLFRTKKYAIRTLMIILSWFSLALTEYGLVTMTSSLTGNLYTNWALMTSINLVVRASSYPVLNFKWIGRKRGFVIYTLFAVVCTLTIMVLDLTGYTLKEENQMVKTWLCILAFGGMSGSWSSVFMFAQELYPTLLRGLATSIGNIAIRVGGVIAPQIILLGTINNAVPFIIICSFKVIAVVMVMLLIPETLNQPLPEDLPQRKSKHKVTHNGASEKEEMDLLAADSSLENGRLGNHA